MLIDVHIADPVKPLTDPTTKAMWDQCAASLINQPINVFHTPPILNDTRQARYNGFQLGDAPYVSFIDPDDMVTPGAFQACLDVLETDPTIVAAYTTCAMFTHDTRFAKLCHPFREWEPKNMLTNLSTEVRQLIVIRRDALMKMYEKHFDDIVPNTGEMQTLICYLSLEGNLKAVDHLGYYWRIHPGCNHLKPKEAGVVEQAAQLMAKAKQAVQLHYQLS